MSPSRLYQIATFVFAGLFSASVLAQSPGDWMIRLGMGHVSPDTNSGDLIVAGEALPGAQIDVKNDSQPIITLGHMLTRHLAIEVLAALPFEHSIKGAGLLAEAGVLGQTKHLPPTVSVQYHFLPNAPFRPYAGIGLNYTTFFSSQGSDALDAALGGPSALSIRDSFGIALQLGADFTLSDRLFFNVDLRYIQIEADARITTASANGPVRSRIKADIDPLVFSAGIGVRF